MTNVRNAEDLIYALEQQLKECPPEEVEALEMQIANIYNDIEDM